MIPKATYPDSVPLITGPSAAEAQMSDGTLASPCVRNCCLDEHEVCIGCGRNLDEIRDWGNAPDSERQHILDRAAARRAEREARIAALFRAGRTG